MLTLGSYSIFPFSLPLHRTLKAEVKQVSVLSHAVSLSVFYFHTPLIPFDWGLEVEKETERETDGPDISAVLISRNSSHLLKLNFLFTLGDVSLNAPYPTTRLMHV